MVQNSKSIKYTLRSLPFHFPNSIIHIRPSPLGFFGGIFQRYASILLLENLRLAYYEYLLFAFYFFTKQWCRIRALSTLSLMSLVWLGRIPLYGIPDPIDGPLGFFQLFAIQKNTTEARHSGSWP